MILHTINKPEILLSCEELIKDSDSVLLLEDAVYLANDPIPGLVHALRSDVLARGFKILERQKIKLIDYKEFVELTCRAEKVCAWF
jgi:sulfur relay protein TusB/DsrH